ncbi:hypothetical protein ACKI1O_51110, partial [Streptomyces scabiei]
KRSDLEAVAEKLLPAVRAALGKAFTVSVIECTSQIGSGALPLETLPSAGLAIRAAEAKREGGAVEALSRALRRLPVPIVGRIREHA